MNDSQFLSLAWTQLVQVSALIALVWILAKLFARKRPHLAHALWLLVLVKCLTPPVMSSPAGVMSHLMIPKPDWLSFEQPVEVEAAPPEIDWVEFAAETPPEPQLELQVSDTNFEIDDLSRGIPIDESELPPEFFVEAEEPLLVAEVPLVEVEPEPAEEPPAVSVPVSSRLWKIWFGSAGFVLLVTIARVMITLHRVYRNRVHTPQELDGACPAAFPSA